MRFNRIQLKLWTVGILGMSGLWFGPAAIAQSTETTLLENTEVTHRSGHDCFDLATEQPEPLGDFREALLSTAAATARQVDNPAQKVDALVNLSKSYICLGQVALSESTASEALSSVDQIESVDERGLALLEMASFYEEQFKDSVQRDTLLSQSLTLIESSPEVSFTQGILLYKIAGQYIHSGEYNKLRNVVDLAENTDIHVSIQELIHKSYYSESEEDKAAIEVTFPELEVDFFYQESSSDLPQEPFIVWF